jgi:8-oxo-dGTP pyrophosphatase MutT (NUDIX family)
MDPPFRRLSSEVVGSFGFLDVEEDRYAGPDGDFTRWVIRHPGAVVVVPIEDGPDGPQAVLVRQFRAAVGGRLLEVPAGKRDVDGEEPVVTAARELEEEIGMRAGQIVKLAEFFSTPGFCDEYAHLYGARDLVTVDELHDLKAEERDMSIERIPLRSYEHWIASGDLVDLKSVAALGLARDWYEGRYAGMDDQTR